MKKKAILFFLFSILFIMVDITLSNTLRIIFSFAYIAYIIATLDVPYNFYFTVIFGFLFDIIFSQYIGPFMLLFFLISLISYTICTFYNIKKLALQLILVPLCFIPFALINKNMNEIFYYILFTEIAAFVTYWLLSNVSKRIDYEKT